MNQKEIIEQLTVFVDEYHALSQPSELAALWRIRKDITERLFALSKLTHNTYGKKALNHLMRKYMISKEIAIALEKDRKAGGKARSMASLETETEALNFTLEAGKAQIEAEQDWEQLISVIKSTEKVLFAMSQEIQDGMKERDYQNNSEGLKGPEDRFHQTSFKNDTDS
jgi:hypothetical protein